MARDFSLLFGLIAAFLLSACQQINGNSLLSNGINDTKSNLLNKDPKADDLYIRAYLNSYSVPSSRSNLEIGGECYASTYPLHKIIVREGNIFREIVDLTTGGSGDTSIAVCRNGKFSFALNVASLKAGMSALIVELEARDASGRVFTNSIQGLSRITVTRF
jgi:hypothetical protein